MLLILIFFIDSNIASAQTSNLTLDHLDVLFRLTSPKISPNGKEIVLISREVDLLENKNVNTLWIINVESKEARKLTHKRPSVNKPQWSPDGKNITFLAVGDNEKKQIFKLPINGGEAQQITHSSTGIITYQWSADGQFIAYVANDSTKVKKENEKYNKSFEVGSDWYLANESPVSAHIWVCTEDGKDENRLTSEETGFSLILGSLGWSSDNKKIAYISQPKPHSAEFLKSTLNIIHIESKEITILDNEFKLPVAPLFSIDDSIIIYRKTQEDGGIFDPMGLYSVDQNGVKNKNMVLNIDRDIACHFWFSDQSILAGASDGTQVSLWRGQLNSQYEKLDLNGVHPSLDNIDVGTSDELVFIGSSSQQPSELYYMKNYKSTPEKLTSFNDSIAHLNLGSVSSINWMGEDGFYEDGVLTYPPNFSQDKKYPLIICIHGGPTASSREHFNFFSQALAAQGWIVFQPNYRGSNNLGKAFQRSIINDTGDGPGKDIMAGIETVKKLGFINSDKIAVSGWSYGGFMTVWLTSHYQGWSSAVAGAALTDWLDAYNMSDLKCSGYLLNGSPWINDNLENYRKQSPITYANEIKTPTLILSNTMDHRVAVSQSIKLFHNLKDNNVEVKFIAYPIPGHFPQDPIHRKDVYERWIKWIKNHF